MSEMRRLAAALETPNVSSDEVYGWLRWFGFNGFTLGFQPFLEHLISMEPALQRLQVLYPNLEPAVRRLLHAREMQTALISELDKRKLESNPALPISDQAEELHRAFDTRAPAPKGLGSSDIDPRQYSTRRFRLDPPVPLGPPCAAGSDGALLMYTASFLLVHIYDAHVQLLTDGQMQGLRLAHEFFNNQHFPSLWTDGLLSFNSLTFEQCRAHILERLSHLSKDSSLDRVLPRTLNQRNLDEFIYLLQHTNLVANFTLGFLDREDEEQTTSASTDSSDAEEDKEDEEYEKKWGNGCSADLDDRNLSLETRYGLSKRDRKTLSFQIDANIDQSREILRNEEHIVTQASPYALNIALATGKTLSAALEMRVVRTSSQDSGAGESGLPGSILTITSSHPSQRSATHWRTAQVDETHLTLPLEFRPPRWPEHCQDFEIHELFLLPPEQILPRVESSLAAKLHRTPKQLRLSTKHALAREMFSFNTNKAAIHFVCDPHERASKGDIDVNTLIHYLSPKSISITNAYKYAQHRLLSGSTDGAIPPMLQCTPDEACMYVPSNAMRPVVMQMIEEVTKHNPNEIWEHHALFAIYVAAFLQAATGHRESAQLFHFLFAVDEKELLAFLADKGVIGSEARFVTLTKTVIAQFLEYKKHILWLIERVSAYDEILAENIKIATGFTKPTSDAQVPTAGLFFTYSDGVLRSVSSGQIQKEMQRISEGLGQTTNLDFGAKAMRKNLITFLANMGVCGMDLEVQLGHNGDHHLFGAASNWIPLERIGMMRPYVNTYLETNGWKLIQASWAVEFNKTAAFPIPDFESSLQAYEGDALDAHEARQRARAAIIAALPPTMDESEDTAVLNDDEISEIRGTLEKTHALSADRDLVLEAFDTLASSWLQADYYELTPIEIERERERCVTRSKHSSSSEELSTKQMQNDLLVKIYTCVLGHIPKDSIKPTAKFKFDETKWKALRSEIQNMTPGDQAAHTKLVSEFSKIANQWRQQGKYLVTATSINLARFEPGPVSPLFGRYLAIARFVKNGLADGITDYLNKAREPKPLERLAVLAVLLVTNDGVLNLLELEQILKVIQREKCCHFEGQYHIRAEITSNKAIYNRTVDLTSKSSAALFGYLNNRNEDEYFTFEKIQLEANALLLRIVEKKVSLDLQGLTEIMKPFWFLRFPGSTYSTCVGNLDSQAPSELSTGLLLGATPRILEIPKPTRKTVIRREKLPFTFAVQETRKLLNMAEGQIELRESSSRAQRKRLRQIFGDNGDIILINSYLSHQVVEYWVRFLEDLLVEGGPRVENYNFGSLKEYQSRVLILLYKHAWDLRLTDMSAEEFDELYNKILGDIKVSRQNSATIVLRFFHDFLRQKMGAPKCSITRSTDRVRRQARSVVFTHKTVEQCVRELSVQGQTKSEIGSAASGIAAAHYVFGLRTKEAYGLLHKDFLEHDFGMLRVSRNTVRGLKTSERTVVTLLDQSSPSKWDDRPYLHSVIRDSFNQSKVIYEPHGKTPIFPNALKPDELTPYKATCELINWSVKHATGDMEAIPYAMRHTYATAVMSSQLMPSPVASQIAVRINASFPKQSYHGCGLTDRSNYPLQVDRLAMSLGQEGVNTLTNFYWHGAWWVAGEHCCRQDQLEANWKDAQIGALLGREKSVIYRRRSAARTDSEAAITDSELVRLYVKQSGERLIEPGVHTETVARPVSEYKPFMLKSVDTLLVLIRQDSESQKLEDIAHESFSISHSATSKILDAYHKVREETQFWDFEPDKFHAAERRTSDVYLGEIRRRGLLASIELYLGKSDLNVQTSLAVIEKWRSTFNTQTPVLLSHSVEEYATQVLWLTSLGYEKKNIRVLCNSNDESLKQQLREKSDSVILRRKFARVSDSRRPIEIGIEIHLGGALPNNVDFHRVMFALACCSIAKLSRFSQQDIGS